MSVDASSLKKRLGPWLTPVMRAIVRYGPRGALRRRIWREVVEPYLAWESHPFVARTVFGDRLAGDTRDILQQYVYYFGIWEPNLTRLLRERLRAGDVFVDVGANVGYFTLLASRLVASSGRVVSIEPSPKLYAALRQNLARNRVRNARALNLAVLDRPGSVALYAGTEYHSGLTTTRPERGLGFECEVEAAALPAILEPREIRDARVIKIDVEGAEASVVQSLGPILAGGRPDLEIVVEIDSKLLADQGQDANAIFELFGEADFHPYLLENDYSAESYLEKSAGARPSRLSSPVDGVADVVFSRRDGAQL